MCFRQWRTTSSCSSKTHRWLRCVAVPEISYLTRQYSSNRFRYPEGLLCLSLIYANLTIIMSLGVYYLEARLQADKRED